MEDEFNPEALEASLSSIEAVDEFNSSIDYERFVVLSKKELANFCRLVDPLTKSAVDDYGKSVFIRCIDNDSVQLLYQNSPFFLSSTVSNKSGKQIKSFALQVATLKRLVTSAFSSIILVEENDEINLSLCESLLFLDTKPLKESQYNFTVKATKESIDTELAQYTFKKIGSALSLTDRASEKTIVIKDSSVLFNTGIFASKSNSPFGGKESFLLYKQVSDVIAILAELSVVSFHYGIHEDIMALNCDDKIYAEVPVGVGERVQEFLSPTAELALSFNPSISIINDNLLRLVTVVKGLEYLSDIITLTFAKDTMSFTVASSNQSKKSVYTFPIIEGTPEIEGEMKITVGVLQIFLAIVGSDCHYSFSDAGLGISNNFGKFLIRKS